MSRLLALAFVTLLVVGCGAEDAPPLKKLTAGRVTGMSTNEDMLCRAEVANYQTEELRDFVMVSLRDKTGGMVIISAERWQMEEVSKLCADDAARAARATRWRPVRRAPGTEP